MAANIIATEDLMDFKSDLLANIKEIVSMQSRMKIKKWIKYKEVRELLSVSAGTIQNLRINGTLPYSKTGGVVYYDYSEIIKFFEVHKIYNKY